MPLASKEKKKKKCKWKARGSFFRPSFAQDTLLKRKKKKLIPSPPPARLSPFFLRKNGYRPGQPCPRRRDAGTTTRGRSNSASRRASPRPIHRRRRPFLFALFFRAKEESKKRSRRPSALSSPGPLLRSPTPRGDRARSLGYLSPKWGLRKGPRGSAGRLFFSLPFFSKKTDLPIKNSASKKRKNKKTVLISLPGPSSPLKAQTIRMQRTKLSMLTNNILLFAFKTKRKLQPKQNQNQKVRASRSAAKAARSPVSVRAEGESTPPPAPTKKDRSGDQLIFASEQSLRYVGGKNNDEKRRERVYFFLPIER